MNFCLQNEMHIVTSTNVTVSFNLGQHSVCALVKDRSAKLSAPTRFAQHLQFGGGQSLQGSKRVHNAEKR